MYPEKCYTAAPSLDKDSKTKREVIKTLLKTRSIGFTEKQRKRVKI